MKVAVSIPDPVFSEAEALARRLNSSRSEIYARALDAFVATHAPERVTEALNAVADETGAEPDVFVRRAARQTLERSDW
jgi:metal-responsive CopG/Arc/MetJ family transcriptional regulator